jgi:hypothetical protein
MADKTPKKMTEDEIQKVVNTQLRKATGWDEDEVTKARELALDYYFMRPRGDEVTGRANVVSGDVSAMIDAVLSQMLDAFENDNLVEFEPTDAADEDQAQLESDAVNHFVMKANNGYMAFLEAIKDALLERNGIIKVWVSERSTTEIREYEDVDPVAFTTLTEAPGMRIDVIEYDPENETLKLRETTVDRKLMVESVALENFLYTENWTSLDLQGIPFCAERKVDSRSALIEMGFDKTKVNGLAAQHETKQLTANRNPKKIESDPQEGPTRSEDQIEYYECYSLLDTDGDGISERRRLVVSGTTLLEDIQVPMVSFAAGAVLINPHRFLGVSLFDKLKQIQDTNTGLNRALLDNANATNKSRLVVRDGKVNADDLEDGRVNGRIRVKNSHQGGLDEAVKALLVPDISQGILLNIEHQKRSRAELGGAALDLATANAQLGSDQIGSQGLDRAYSVMEQLAAMMTKIIARTLIRSVYLLTHETLRQFFDKPVDIRQSARWAAPVPTEWKKRNILTVKPGMSVGERTRLIGSLGSILDKQLTLSEQGLDDVIVNIDGFYAALMDWARAAEISNPEQYFIDPTSDESKEALKSKQAAQKQAQDNQATLIDQALGLERLRTAFEKYKTDTELQFKYWNANLDSEVEEAKIIGDATTKLVAARVKPAGAGANGKADSQKETD